MLGVTSWANEGDEERKEQIRSSKTHGRTDASAITERLIDSRTSSIDQATNAKAMENARTWICFRRNFGQNLSQTL